MEFFFNELAEGTGGVYFPVDSAGEVVDAITGNQMGNSGQSRICHSCGTHMPERKSGGQTDWSDWTGSPGGGFPPRDTCAVPADSYVRD